MSSEKENTAPINQIYNNILVNKSNNTANKMIIAPMIEKYW